MDHHDHPFWTERFESEAALRESNALTFTAAEFYESCGGDPTEEDYEVLELAMDRDMDERQRCWLRENDSLRTENRRLRATLGED